MGKRRLLYYKQVTWVIVAWKGRIFDKIYLSSRVLYFLKKEDKVLSSQLGRIRNLEEFEGLIWERGANNLIP